MGAPDKKLLAAQIRARLKKLPHWKQVGKALIRIQTFPRYKDALNFVTRVGNAAERNDHHPDIVMNFKRVKVVYSTHSAGGISGLDFKMAGIVEKIAQKFS